MIYMKTILSILFLSCALLTNAQMQVKAYSLEEMKAGFISQYVNHEPEPSLTEYDEIWFDSQLYATYGDEKDSIDPYYANKIKSLKRIMESDPSLRVVKNKVLPPSIYLWIYDKENKNATLYWIGFKDDKGSKKQTKLREWLCKQFGTVVIENCTLVPAKWFSGQLKILESPMVYGNTLVALSLYIANVVNGEFEKSKYSYPSSRYEWSHLESDVKYIREGIMEVSTHGPWSRKQRKAMALNLFARDVNKLCTLQRDIRPVEYSFLFFVDSEFKTHLHVLLPSQLNAEDEKRISELSNAIEAQPTKVFGRYWTLEVKRFSGRYVKAIFDGRGWHFSDYNCNE